MKRKWNQVKSQENTTDVVLNSNWFRIPPNNFNFEFPQKFLSSEESKFEISPEKLHLIRKDEEHRNYLLFWLHTIDFYRTPKLKTTRTFHEENQKIYLFGVAKNEKDDSVVSVSLKIENFCPYLHVVLPTLDTHVATFKDRLINIIQQKSEEKYKVFPGARKNLSSSNYHHFAVHEILIQIRRGLIGFHPLELKKVSALATIYCKNDTVRKNLARLLKNYNFYVSHDFVKPEVQFMTEMLGTKIIPTFNLADLQKTEINHKFSVCKWFQVYNFQRKDKEDEFTLCTMEANVRMEDIQVVENEDNFQENILLPPKKLKVMALDIETMSAARLEHPNPNKRKFYIDNFVSFFILLFGR